MLFPSRLNIVLTSTRVIKTIGSSITLASRLVGERLLAFVGVVPYTGL